MNEVTVSSFEALQDVGGTGGSRALSLLSPPLGPAAVPLPLAPAMGVAPAR